MPDQAGQHGVVPRMTCAETCVRQTMQGHGPYSTGKKQFDMVLFPSCMQVMLMAVERSLQGTLAIVVDLRLGAADPGFAFAIIIGISSFSISLEVVALRFSPISSIGRNGNCRAAPGQVQAPLQGCLNLVPIIFRSMTAPPVLSPQKRHFRIGLILRVLSERECAMVMR